MASLARSSKALDTLAQFHKKPHIIFVEGSDDLLFWRKVVEKFGLSGFHIKRAGGSYEIEKYCVSIIRDDADIIIARDCDYTDILRHQHKHPRILYTHGYSIENSIYCPKSIAAAIALYAKTLEDYEEEAAKWLEEFTERFKSLIALDLANEMLHRGQVVLGDNCARFLKSGTSHLVAEDKIRDAHTRIEPHFAEVEIQAAGSLIEGSSKPIALIIRGHFLTHAIANFIKARVKAETRRTLVLSNDNLYAIMVSQFDNMCMDWSDFSQIQAQIEAIAAGS